MDRQKIIQMAAQIATSVETVHVAGEHDRAQLSGIYRTAHQIIAEASREEAQQACSASAADEAARTEG